MATTSTAVAQTIPGLSLLPFGMVSNDAEGPAIHFHRRKQRLPSASYHVPGTVWHLTFGAADREANALGDPVLGREILDSFETGCINSGAILHLACLMPDHAHLIVELGSLGLVDLVQRLKSFTTRLWWKHGGSGQLWQKSFYDHGIRDTRDFDAAMNYVLENPVRAGLADTWEAYPLLTGRAIDPE